MAAPPRHPHLNISPWHDPYRAHAPQESPYPHYQYFSSTSPPSSSSEYRRVLIPIPPTPPDPADEDPADPFDSWDRHGHSDDDEAEAAKLLPPAPPLPSGLVGRSDNLDLIRRASLRGSKSGSRQGGSSSGGTSAPGTYVDIRAPKSQLPSSLWATYNASKPKGRSVRPRKKKTPPADDAGAASEAAAAKSPPPPAEDKTPAPAPPKDKKKDASPPARSQYRLLFPVMLPTKNHSDIRTCSLRVNSLVSIGFLSTICALANTNFQAQARNQRANNQPSQPRAHLQRLPPKPRRRRKNRQSRRPSLLLSRTHRRL